jgi:hypothetical protein
MKKLSLLCALLLAFTLTSLAQTGGGSGSGSGSGAAAQSGSGSTGNNGQTGTASPGTPSTSDQSGSMSQPSDKDKTSGDKDSSMKNGKKADMKGCISQSGSNYMLMDKKHPDGVQISSSQDLSAHVGHKVEVKGTWADANSTSGSGSGSSMSSTSSGGSSASSGGTKAINVTDIKMISDHCDDANNSNTKKDSDKK